MTQLKIITRELWADLVNLGLEGLQLWIWMQQVSTINLIRLIQSQSVKLSE